MTRGTLELDLLVVSLTAIIFTVLLLPVFINKLLELACTHFISDISLLLLTHPRRLRLLIGALILYKCVLSDCSILIFFIIATEQVQLHLSLSLRYALDDWLLEPLFFDLLEDVRGRCETHAAHLTLDEGRHLPLFCLGHFLGLIVVLCLFWVFLHYTFQLPLAHRSQLIPLDLLF